MILMHWENFWIIIKKIFAQSFQVKLLKKIGQNGLVVNIVYLSILDPLLTYYQFLFKNSQRKRWNGVPTLTWISDIASVIQNSFKPVFVDINPKTLCMDEKQVLNKLNKKTKAVFLTRTLGLWADIKIIERIKKRKIPLIEDVCVTW